MAATLLGDWEDKRAAMEASLLDELEEAIEASLLEKKNAIGASFLEEAIEASLLEDTNTQIENENAGRLVVEYVKKHADVYRTQILNMKKVKSEK